MTKHQSIKKSTLTRPEKKKKKPEASRPKSQFHRVYLDDAGMPPEGKSASQNVKSKQPGHFVFQTFAQ